MSKPARPRGGDRPQQKITATVHNTLTHIKKKLKAAVAPAGAAGKRGKREGCGAPARARAFLCACAPGAPARATQPTCQGSGPRS